MHKSPANRGIGRQQTWPYALVGVLECLPLTYVLESVLCLGGAPGRGRGISKTVRAIEIS